MTAHFSQSSHNHANVQLGKRYWNETPLPTLVLATVLFGFMVLCILQGVMSANDVMRSSFLTLGFGCLFFAVILLVKYESSGLYIFEPFSIVTLTYVLVYLIAPIIQFSEGDTTRYGVDVAHNCALGTIVAVVSYLVFFIGYETKQMNRGPSGKGARKSKSSFFRGRLSSTTERYVARLGLILWIVSYAVCLIFQLSKGFSLSYVLTGGLGGATADELSESSVGFLSYLKYSLAGLWMLIFVFGGNRGVKVVTFLLTMSMMFLGGSRAALIIPLIAPIAYWYIKDGRSPRVGTILVFLAALVLLFAVMQVARVGIRAGAGMNLSGQTLESLFEPFRAEIEDYKCYYVLFDVVPQRYPYLLGYEMFVYSLILFIPRALWPGKPDPPVHEIVRLGFGDRAMVNGVAYPNLGEFYVEFGIAGCIICMFLFGVICKTIKTLYLESHSRSFAAVTYCLVYPALFQIIIRGYMPQNFSTLIFLLTPIFVVWVITKAREKDALMPIGAQAAEQ